MWFKKIFILFIVFCLYYKPEFVFIPHSINTFFGLVGMCLFFTRPKITNDILSQSSASHIKVISYLIPIFVVAFVSCVINFSTSTHYVTYIITNTFAFFGCYFLATLFYGTYEKFTPRSLIEYILVAQAVYMTLSVMMYVIPGVSQILLSLLKLSEGSLSAYDRLEGVRLLCFGASFFTAGIINGFVLILLAFYISIYQHPVWKQVLLYVYYIIIVAVGMMMARTTIVGGLIGVGIMAIYWIKNNTKILRIGLILAAIFVFAYSMIARLSSGLTEQLETLSEFAFEMFINYEESGELSSSSTNTLMEMYETYPDNLLTWVIGDAKWSNSDGTYYKHVDVGYLRDIFYFGIIGVIVMIIYWFNVLKYTILRGPLLRQGNVLLFLSLLGYVLILNLKGNADMFYYIVPFIFCTNDESA